MIYISIYYNKIPTGCDKKVILIGAIALLKTVDFSWTLSIRTILGLRQKGCF